MFESRAAHARISHDKLTSLVAASADHRLTSLVELLNTLNSVVSNYLVFASQPSVGWIVLLLVREEVLLAGLCERKILF